MLKPCRKRSEFMSTMPAIDTVFGGKLCQGRHEHAHFTGGEAHDAQVYPSQLCKAIVSAIKLQKKWDARGLELLATIETEGKLPAENPGPPEEEAANEILEAWDDVSGKDPNPATVLAAKREEIATRR